MRGFKIIISAALFLLFCHFSYGLAESATITGLTTFTETSTNHPWGNPDGWYMFFWATVEDPMGVPVNIESVTAVNLDTNIDPNEYTLDYHTPNNEYFLRSIYNNQRGTYRFTVMNKQGGTDVADAYPIDNPLRLDDIQNLAVSDSSTTPTFTFNSLANAEKYRMSIYNSSGKRLYNSNLSDTPSFSVPSGVMTAGNLYYIRAEARDINTTDGDGVNDAENRSRNWLTFTPGGSISGTLTYSGSQSGTIYVGAFTFPVSCDYPIPEDPDYAVEVSSLGGYTLPGLPDGAYYIGAVIATCGTDCDIELADPWGLYNGCENITPVVISGSNNISGIDMDLSDGTSESPNPLYKAYPQIISRSPYEQEDGVPTDSTIEVVFSKSMRTDIVFDVFDQYENEVDGIVTWSNTAGNANDTFTFTPSSPLRPATVYHVRLLGFGIWDASETYCLGGGCRNYRYSFQTAADTGDTVPPSVMSIKPYNGETGVKRRRALKVYFSEGMDQTSFIAGCASGNVCLTGPGISDADYWVEYQFGRRGGIEGSMPVLRINLRKNMTALSTYTVTVGPSVADISGNPMGSSFVYSFTTGQADTTPPGVSQILPADGDTNVPVMLNIWLIFDEGVKRSTLITDNVTLERASDGLRIPLFRGSRTAGWGEDRSNIRLTPEVGSVALDYNTQYRISVSGIKDWEGNSITPLESFFTTVPDGNTSADPVFVGVRYTVGLTGSSGVDMCIVALDFDCDSGLAPDDCSLDVTTTAPASWTLLKEDPDRIRYYYESREDEFLAAGKLNVDFSIADAAGNSLALTWPIRIFPDVPSLLSPADGEGNVSTTPTFGWDISGLTGPTEWSAVVVSDKPEESEGVQVLWMGFHIRDDTTAYSLTMPQDQALENCTTYYWKAVAGDHERRAQGFAFSEERSFTTESLPGDADCDGISDGDGTNPCTGGNTTNCDDNCLNTHNPLQEDMDGDLIGDACDNCREVENWDQRDTNYPDDDNPVTAGMQHYGNMCDPDFDNDGIVSILDLALWRQNVGEVVPPAPADVDINGDGAIWLQDLAVWRRFYGTPPGPGIGD